MKTTQKTLTAKIAEKTRLTPYKSRKILKTVLKQITLALGDGKQVDLGKLGKLVVVTRKPVRRIVNKLNGYTSKTILDIHKKYPKTVRLLGRGRDLSEDPQPTIITKKSEEAAIQTNVRRSVAIAIPSWRRRFR